MTRETFGQSATPAGQPSAMAHGSASSICDGMPAPFAGLIWHRQGDSYQTLYRQVHKVMRLVA